MSRITLTLDQLPPVDEPLRVQIKNTFVEVPETSDDEFSFLDTNPRRMVTDSVLYKHVPTEALGLCGIDENIKEVSEVPTTTSGIDCTKRDCMSPPNLIGYTVHDLEPHPEPILMPTSSIKNSVPLKAEKEASETVTYSFESCSTVSDSPLLNSVRSPFLNPEPYPEPMVCPPFQLVDSNPPKGKKSTARRGKRAENKVQASRANGMKEAHADLISSSLSCVQLPFAPIHAESMNPAPFTPINTVPIISIEPIHAERVKPALVVKFCHQCGNSRTMGHNFCTVCGIAYLGIGDCGKEVVSVPM